MQFSTYFSLNTPKNGFKFFDINVFADTQRFIDPYCIQRDRSPLGRQMAKGVSVFMYELLNSIRNQQYLTSLNLCSQFGETKGTRLGYSLKRLDGHGAGNKLSKDFVNNLYASSAVTGGTVRHLEETMLVCENIDRDIISDITISIVKQQLISFTQDICQKYGIPTKLISEDISYYCAITRTWKRSRFELPHVYDSLTGKESYIILIPERIIPSHPTYNIRYFYSNIAIPLYKDKAIEEGLPYVYRDKSGVLQVRSGDIRHDLQFGGQKPKMSNLINDQPELLPKYRNEVASYKFDKFD